MAEDAKRGQNIFYIDPRQIAVNWARNHSRGCVEPKVDDALIAMARDMRPRTPGSNSSGQLNPITVRPCPGQKGKHEVVGGFRRLRAGLYLIESGECPDFQIQYKIVRLNDAEAALANIQENLQREDPQPIQMAHAVRYLTEDCGLSGKAVAERLGKSEAWVSQTLALVTLAAPIQESIAAGETTVTAGHALAKLPESEQVEVFTEIKAEIKAAKRASQAAEKAVSEKAAGNARTGKPTAPKPAPKISVAEVKKKHREKAEQTGQKVTIARSLRDLKTFLENRITPVDGSQKGKDLASILLGFLAGTTGEEEALDVWLASTE